MVLLSVEDILKIDELSVNARYDKDVYVVTVGTSRLQCEGRASTIDHAINQAYQLYVLCRKRPSNV